MPARRLLSLLLSLLSLTACEARLPAGPATADLVEINDLYARFTVAANDHSWDVMAALMAEDVTWTAAAGALGFEHHGRPAVRAWLAGNEGKLEVVFYQAGPPRLELVSPERARAHVSMTELLLLKQSGELKQLFGVYRDELRKVDGRWRFAARRFELRRELTLTSSGISQQAPAPERAAAAPAARP